MNELFGNESTKAYFDDAVKAKTLSHAYIFEGPHLGGKHTLVNRILLGMVPESQSQAKERIIRSSSPDVYYYGLAEKRRTIGVDTIRELRSEAFILPSELDFKAFIISDADTMTVSAQNAALKILEEPPANVYFFLLCQNASSLLPTVRSRAMTIRLERFSEETLDCYLQKNEKYARIKQSDPTRYENALRTSQGALGSAMASLDELSGEETKAYDAVLYIVKAFSSRSSDEIFRSANCLPSSRSDADYLLALLLSALRDLEMIKSGSDGDMLFFKDKSEAAEIAKNIPERSIFEAYSRVRSLCELLALNINMTNARLCLLEALLGAAGL